MFNPFKLFKQAEPQLIDFAASFIPWLAPMPSAWLVGSAAVKYMGWPNWVAVIAAAVVEGMGLSSVSTALELWEFNQTRRKGEPEAPFTLAAILAGIYLVVAIVLVVLLDLFPQLAHVAPAIFPALSIVGAVVMALRAGHRRRLAQAVAEKAERKAERQAARQAERQLRNAQELPKLGAQIQPSVGDDLVQMDAQKGAQNGVLDTVNRTRAAQREALLDALLDAYESNPNMGATEAARLLNVHRNSIYNYTQELEQAGRLHKNGHGWEVRR